MKKASLNHDHDKKYMNKEVCEERENTISLRFSRNENQIECNRKDIQGINKKINGTLVFGIATTLLLIVELVINVL